MRLSDLRDRAPEYQAGQRVRLAAPMRDDPDPVPVGTEGTVTHSHVVDLGDGPWEQVSIDWDGGRRLMVCVPPDHLEVLR